MLICCTSCNAKLKVPENAVGKKVRCPKCATIIKIHLEPQADLNPVIDNAETSLLSAPSPSDESESVSKPAPLPEPKAPNKPVSSPPITMSFQKMRAEIVNFDLGRLTLFGWLVFPLSITAGIGVAIVAYTHWGNHGSAESGSRDSKA